MSPVVHQSFGKSQYDQFAHLKKVGNVIKAKTGIEIKFVTNEDYLDTINSLRAFAGGVTKELKSPVNATFAD